MNGQNELCFCGSGKKHKKCHQSINKTSTLANLYKVFDSIDKEVKDNSSSVCSGDCHDCCTGYFYITEAEFYCILDFLQQNMPHIIPTITEEACKQVETLLKAYPDEYHKLFSVVKRTTDYDVWRSISNDSHIRSLDNCIFLDEHMKCIIYKVRPIICRTFGCYSDFSRGCIRTINYDSLLLKLPTADIDNSIVILSDGVRSMLRRPYPIVYWFGDIYKNYQDDIAFRTKQSLYAQGTEKRLTTYLFDRDKDDGK